MPGIDSSLVAWYKACCSCWGSFHWLQVFQGKPFVTVLLVVIFINMWYCILRSTCRALPVREEQGMRQAAAAACSRCQCAEFFLNCPTKYCKKTPANNLFISYCTVSGLSTNALISWKKPNNWKVWAVAYPVSGKERPKQDQNWVDRSLKSLRTRT